MSIDFMSHITCRQDELKCFSGQYPKNCTQLSAGYMAFEQEVFLAQARCTSEWEGDKSVASMTSINK